MQVANCTTPAQYFHLLRRQMYGGPDRRGMRKPLVVFTPKSLLRHPQAVSRVEEFTGGGFREVLGDDGADAPDVSRMLLCSGKIYYDLLAAREESKAQHVAIVRVEQFYPFPAQDLEEILARYARARKWSGCRRSRGTWERGASCGSACSRCSTPAAGPSVCRPAGERQPGHGLPQAPPHGAGCDRRGSLRNRGLARQACGPPGP